MSNDLFHPILTDALLNEAKRQSLLIFYEAKCILNQARTNRIARAHGREHWADAAVAYDEAERKCREILGCPPDGPSDWLDILF